ncbi:MAG: hypothetical protein RLN70_08815, partial [Rhodospirillaceae bacterium]
VRLIWKEKAPWRWLKALGKDLFGTELEPLDGSEKSRFCALDVYSVDGPAGERVFQARYDWSSTVPGVAVAATSDPGQADALVCLPLNGVLQYPVVATTPSGGSQTAFTVTQDETGLEPIIDIPGMRLFARAPAFHTVLLTQEGTREPAVSYVMTFDAPAPDGASKTVTPLLQASIG